MELLNGKAKELFDTYIMSRTSALELVKYMPPCCINALIIEWLDSVNIAITIRPKNIKSWNYEVHDFKNIDYVFDCEFESRKQATVEAIKKAVELIDESNGK